MTIGSEREDCSEGGGLKENLTSTSLPVIDNMYSRARQYVLSCPTICTIVIDNMYFRQADGYNSMQRIDN